MNDEVPIQENAAPAVQRFADLLIKGAQELPVHNDTIQWSDLQKLFSGAAARFQRGETA